MTMIKTTNLRYQLPKKAIKGDCPQCSPKYRKTLSRFIDTRTGEPLPELYGRCDRESNCGYFCSPYEKGPLGMSYADQIYQQWKEANPMVQQNYSHHRTSAVRANHIKRFAIEPLIPIRLQVIPDEIFTKSLSRFDGNSFAISLQNYFGESIATDLLTMFQVGSSRCWNDAGASVFWLIDELGRKRGAQVKLFDYSFHTVKYVDKEGRKRSRTSWVHSILAYQYDKAKKPRPDWLKAYIDQGEFAPCLFGLLQLLNAPRDLPIGLVEAPKTSILCTPYFPQFIWMAVIGRSYLNAERLAPLYGRQIVLFPDLSIDGKDYQYWQDKAAQLSQQGFNVIVSDYLESHATDEQRAKGYDLADFLLSSPWSGPPTLPKRISQANNDKARRIQDTVKTSDLLQVILPANFQLPALIWQYWKLFARPPLYWNKIATHIALVRCLASEVETSLRSSKR
jgi:hypothetical protein